MSDSNSVIPGFDTVTLPPSGAKKENPFGPKDNKEKRTPTQYWLNVGVNVAVKNPDGTDGTVFVSLPIGISCDGMREALKRIPDESSKNPEFRRLVIAQHQLVMVLESKMASTRPGERVSLAGLSAELYHVKPGETLETVEKSDNLLAGFVL